MNSIVGLSETDGQKPHAKPFCRQPRRYKRLSAALVSALVPGAGQLLLGRVGSGALFLAIFTMIIALFWPLRLPKTYLGFCVSVLSVVALAIVAAWHAARCFDEQSAKLSRWWLLLLVPLAYLLAIVAANRILRISGFQIFGIPSSAMENTLLVGDHVLVDRSYYRSHQPQSGDVAIFRRGPTWFVKRIIAVGGDTIYGRSGIVYRNGELLSEPYVIHIGAAGNQYTDNFGSITVPAGQVFVIGDNRDVSYDSRQPDHGPIPLSPDSGKPLYIIWSRSQRRIGMSVQ